jgi:hypothetical protein
MARLSSQSGLGGLVLGLLLSWSHRSLAQTPEETIDLRYDASPGCPSRDELLRAIHSRAPRGLSAADDRSFRVRIEHDEADYHGRLEVERKGRVLSVREIRGETCEVVSTALAVFVAIALDPAELLGPVEPSASTATPAAPPPKVATPPTPPAGAMPRPAPPAARWHWGAGLDLRSVLHPSVAWGGRVEGAIARFAPGAHLAPELRLSWGWADFSETPARGGEASFRFHTGRVEACGQLERAPLALAGCAGFEAGRLTATTRGLPRSGGTTEGWYAPTVTLRPGWFLAEALALEAELGVLVPLTEGTFVVTAPERVVYRIPRVAFTAALGFRIWARLP